jgi:hypothetical protein
MRTRRTFGLAHTTFCRRFPNLVNSKKADPQNQQAIPHLAVRLLLLLGMKCRFLRLQIRDQGLNPFNRDLIANRQEHLPVMRDLFVELDARVAHGETRSSRVPRQPLWDACW